MISKETGEYKFISTVVPIQFVSKPLKRKEANLKMKRNHIHKSIKIAVCLLVLVHLATSVIHFKCPTTISKYCSCQTDPDFLISCSKNNEQISLNSKWHNLFKDRFVLEFNCTNNSNEEIYELLNFDVPSYNNDSDIWLLINECPMSVVSFMKHSILDKINFINIEINTNSVTLPANILRDQTKLTHFSVTGRNLTSLPENIFINKTSMTSVDIAETSLTELPENIFSQQTNLISLFICGNKLTTLPEKIFNS